jgi:hypothetical protein
MLTTTQTLLIAVLQAETTRLNFTFTSVAAVQLSKPWTSEAQMLGHSSSDCI